MSQRNALRAQVVEGNCGKIVATDIETACDRLEANYPEAQIWMVRIGSRHVRQFGGRTKIIV